MDGQRRLSGHQLHVQTSMHARVAAAIILAVVVAMVSAIWLVAFPLSWSGSVVGRAKAQKGWRGHERA